MALSINYEVISRYFFGSPTIWVADITDYLLLYATFLPAAWLLKRGGHVKLTLMLEHVSLKKRLIIEIINSIISVVVCAFVVLYGAFDTWEAFEKNIIIPRPMEVSKYLIIIIIPFGTLLLLFQFIAETFKYIDQLKSEFLNDKNKIA
jgi:TRAP-type C4-dicarboxylate transport system permease small subunit